MVFLWYCCFFMMFLSVTVIWGTSGNAFIPWEIFEENTSIYCISLACQKYQNDANNECGLSSCCTAKSS